MIQCQNCGQIGRTSNFCRSCGTKFPSEQLSNGGNFEFEQPRPYSWKTDELQMSESRARKTKQFNQVQPIQNPVFNNHSAKPQPLAYRQPQNMAAVYRCPRCANQQIPRIERKISTAGWIVFAVLMVAFFPLFWIGLLIKEDVRFCSVCNLRLN